MTQKELQNELGMAMKRLSISLQDNKYNERETRTIQTMCSVAKQMVNNADIIIRASKMTGDKDVLKDLLK